jgi:hypothetical protein
MVSVRFALCLCALGAVGVAAAPVISLNLDEATGMPTEYAAGAKAGMQSDRERTGSAAYGGGTHGFTENFSKTCHAMTSTPVTCPMPTARAYDHHDGELTVIQKLYRVNNNGIKGSTTQTFSEIDYNLRSEWLLTFDAEDRSGNKAQQVVFAMILDDQVAPVITPKVPNPTTIEACNRDNLYQETGANRQYWDLPNNNIATDNYDGNLEAELKILVTAPNSVTPQEYVQGDSPTIKINTHVLGDWTIIYSSHDHAGMFGHSGIDNSVQLTAKIVVADTLPPVIYCKTHKCVFETGGIRNADFIKEIAITDGKQECCDKCEAQQWQRVMGTNNGNNEAACAYFVAKGNKCELFGAGALAAPLTTVAGAEGGYPVQSGHDNIVECHTPYADPGARCIDFHDSLMSSGSISDTALAASVTTTGTANPDIVGPYTIKYNCKDLTTNTAAEVTRTVKVEDKTNPVLDIVTGNTNAAQAASTGQASYSTKANIDDLYVVQHSAGDVAHLAHVQRLLTSASGYTCADTCSGTLTDSVVVTVHTGPNGCNGDVVPSLDTSALMMPNTYHVKYVCTDAATNSVNKCRTIIVEDHKKPIITIIGSDAKTFEATRDSEYIDEGATCSDEVDGLIPENVEVGGDVVRLNVPQAYQVIYSCKDAAGNPAEEAIREVLVRDTTCPTCVIQGATEVTREASFPYVDGGAICTDTLAGAVSAVTVGLENVDVETTGIYRVTYTATDGQGNLNDGSDLIGTCISYVRTVTVKDTLRPVIALRYNGALIHTSESADKGVNNQQNPAGTFGVADVGNPHLDAPSALAALRANSNSWLVAGALSAVAGGLLALGGRASTKTQVPV